MPWSARGRIVLSVLLRARKRRGWLPSSAASARSSTVLEEHGRIGKVVVASVGSRAGVGNNVESILARAAEAGGQSLGHIVQHNVSLKTKLVAHDSRVFPNTSELVVHEQLNLEELNGGRILWEGEDDLNRSFEIRNESVFVAEVFPSPRETSEHAIGNGNSHGRVHLKRIATVSSEHRTARLVDRLHQITRSVESQIDKSASSIELGETLGEAFGIQGVDRDIKFILRELAHRTHIRE